MSALQWALLVIGVVAVIGIFVSSRSSGRLPKSWTPAGTGKAPGRLNLRLPGQDQPDLFDSKGEFDEFGVGRPRPRVAPGFGDGETPSLFDEAPSAAAQRQAPTLEVPKKIFEEKIVTLLIAEREGAAIDGATLHAALAAQNLQFGERKIYHRVEGAATVFSVASLIKPGTLDPAEQAQFSTRGLSVFALLPGPVAPRAALQDMIGTARALALQLNAEVFDSSKQVFNADAQRVLVAEVDAWAKRNGLQ